MFFGFFFKSSISKTFFYMLEYIGLIHEYIALQVKMVIVC